MDRLFSEKMYLQQELMEHFDLNQEMTDEEINHYIEEKILLRARKRPLLLEEKQMLKKELFNYFNGKNLDYGQ